MNDTPGNTTATMEIAELDTQRLPLSEVSPHPQNPRIHSDRQIKELQNSLTEHGYAAGSMTVQRSTMRLVKGHGIYEALLGLECVEADFVVVDMDDAEALLFLARDNRLSDLSSFDVPKLKAITVELQKIDVPLERIGFDEGEFAELTNEWAVSEAEYPTLATGDRQPFQQMTFTLSDEQAEEVKSALAKAKAAFPFVDTGNENSNGNALARMAETYLGQS